MFEFGGDRWHPYCSVFFLDVLAFVEACVCPLVILPSYGKSPDCRASHLNLAEGTEMIITSSHPRISMNPPFIPTISMNPLLWRPDNFHNSAAVSLDVFFMRVGGVPEISCLIIVSHQRAVIKYWWIQYLYVSIHIGWKHTLKLYPSEIPGNIPYQWLVTFISIPIFNSQTSMKFPPYMNT